jgi:hypothetical protein
MIPHVRAESRVAGSSDGSTSAGGLPREVDVLCICARRTNFDRGPGGDGIESKPSSPNDVGHRLGSIGHTKLVEDARDVIFHRLLTEPEDVRDLAIPKAGGQMAKNVQLARGEHHRGVAIRAAGPVANGVQPALDQIGPNDQLVRERIVTASHAPDQHNELGGLDHLRDVSRGPDCERTEAARIVVRSADHDDRRRTSPIGSLRSLRRITDPS